MSDVTTVDNLPIGAVQAEKCHICEFVDGRWQILVGPGHPLTDIVACPNCGSALLVLNGVPHMVPAGTWQAMARWLAGMVSMKHNALNTMAPADAQLPPPSVGDWLLMAMGETAAAQAATAGAAAGDAAGDAARAWQRAALKHLLETGEVVSADHIFYTREDESDE